jgi:hypothetical protein
MRLTLAFAALALASCSSDPTPPADAGQDVAVDLGGPDTGATTDTGIDAPRDTTPTIDDPPVTDTVPGVDAGKGDTGADVVRVDGAPCIPACAAGSVCVGGVCEAVDGGADAGAVDGGPPRPTAEPREFQSCEPLGTSCGGDGGVTCVRPDRTPDAGARGACLRPCTTGVESDCPEGSRCVVSGGNSGGYCARPCVAGQGVCGDAGTVCETSLRDGQRYCL